MNTPIVFLPYLKKEVAAQQASKWKKDDNQNYPNTHVNNILWPLISIMIIVAEEFKFDYPFSRYHALREQKADS
ncbi:hypothetical protein [Photobacterium leiognathi]|uniref:hypothetical protein n=1 Tax=Photobacterium leiognathi TaxID=553611 RepID=UPI00298143BB|nr:hypothetical protein [Photobacterium leiognathi]